MAPLVTPPTQSTLKLSKLVKLGCETLFGTIDAVARKNWLERVLDTLIDMELDDELQLRIATRLMDKSVVV